MSFFDLNSKTYANRALHTGTLRHRASVQAAYDRMDERATRREARDRKREKILNAALWVVSIVGAIVATAVTFAVFAC